MAKGQTSGSNRQQAKSSSSLSTSQSSTRILTAFSPVQEGDSGSGSTLFFAQAQLAVDADTIRVFDCKNGGQCTARWSSRSAEQQARVTAITWATLSPSTQTSEEKATRGKKRRKSSTAELQDAAAAASTSATPAILRQSQPVLCIGLSNGSVLLLHPRQSSVVATLSHPSSAASSIQCLSYAQNSEQAEPSNTLWSCSSTGQILAWQLPKLDGNDARLLAAYEGPGAGWSSLAIRYQDGKAMILLAKHAIHLLEAESPEPGTSKEIQRPTISSRSKFTGHPSEVTQLLWLVPKHAQPLVNGHAKSPQQLAFASCASEDRSLNVWATVSDSEEGVLQGTVSFENTVRCMSTSSSAMQICAVLTSGSGAIVAAQASSTPLPAASEKKKRRKSTIPTLDIQCAIAGPTDGSGAIDSCFQHGDQSITIARNSVKPSFHAARVVDEDGQALSSLDLGHIARSKGLLADERVDQVPANARTGYAEPAQSTVLSGDVVQSDAPPKGKAPLHKDASGSEATLAQRLKSLQVRQQDADIDREGGLAIKRPGQPVKGGRLRIADVTSLSQSLVQALHSSDAKLLESCLEKTNPKILRNTIRRVPNTLVIPLVEALVERLGRSKQGFGAGAGGVDAMRGHALIEWLRHVLTIHLAYLITVPSLVSRLASLYATMETRVAHHNQLLALNGRLDLVVSQIDLTSDAVPTQRLPAPKAQKASKAPATRKYVEGQTSSSESDESEDEAGTSQQPIPAPAEQDDDVEDLVMQEGSLLNGTESGSDEESDEEDDMPALRKSQVAKLNGFLELEAEETDEADSDEDPGASKGKKEKPAFSLVNGDLGEDEDEDEGEDLDRYESDFINDEESEEESNGDSD